MNRLSTRIIVALALLALSTINSPLSTSLAQGTAFTYQGQLQNNGSPASGTYDLTFSLFETKTGGAAVGGPITYNAVPVSNGLFTVPIDFGASVFTGATNWLQIGVATNGVDTFSTLAPRQELTPTPYSIYSTSAGFLASGVAAGPSQGDTVGSGDVDSFIGGGQGNTIQNSVNYSVIGGGDDNVIQSGDNESFIGGGTGNSIQANSPDSAIVGGLNNVIQANAGWSFIGGGSSNVVYPTSFGSVIVGGTNNIILTNGFYSAIVGGSDNIIGEAVQTEAPSMESFIGGGTSNQIQEGRDETIGGGENNFIADNFGPTGFADTVAGGSSNSIVSVSLGGIGGFCTIGGGSQNMMYGGGGEFTVGGTIAGGIQNTLAYGLDSSIGGGIENLVDTLFYSAIGGGYSNRIGNYDVFFNDGIAATIAGGEYNFVAQVSGGTIGGGVRNTVTATTSAAFLTASSGTIGGGASNLVNGSYGTIPGGALNVATNYAFAAGQQAQATNQGAFVWADSQNAPFSSTTNDQFCVRAQGGVQLDPTTSVFFGAQTRQMLNLYSNSIATYAIGVQTDDMYFRTSDEFWWYEGGTHNNNFGNAGGGTMLMRLGATGNLIIAGTLTQNSDRNVKSGFEPVDSRLILEKIAAMPFTRWHYTNNVAAPHLGPMAQDFYAAFGLGEDDKHITTVDEGGVALAAIQGLNQKLETQDDAKDAEIQELKQQNDSLARRMNELEATVKSLAGKN